MPITYRYARFSILAPSVVMIPGYLLAAWVIATAQNGWTRALVIAGLAFLIAVTVRSLLRLGDIIVITSEGLTRKSLFGEMYLTWSKIKLVKKYTSLLERDCFRVEATGGESVSVSEYLVGYDDLYKLVLDLAPPGAAESAEPVMGQRVKVESGDRKCPTCGSVEFAPMKGSLLDFYQSCTTCGAIMPAPSVRGGSRQALMLARASLVGQTILGTTLGAVVLALGFLLFLCVGYVLVWAGWNFLISPIAGVSRFSILETRNFFRWCLPGVFVSTAILILLVRYLPLRFLPSVFHASTFRKQKV